MLLYFVDHLPQQQSSTESPQRLARFRPQSHSTFFTSTSLSFTEATFILTTVVGKLDCAADGGEVARLDTTLIPPPVTMLRNKVEVTIDGICTMALVDTGAMRSVMSLSFKNRLRRKVMFSLDTHAKFRGVRVKYCVPLVFVL